MFRCHWYADDGEPIQREDGGRGCPKYTPCTFVHPFEPDRWKNALPASQRPNLKNSEDRAHRPPARMRSPSPRRSKERHETRRDDRRQRSPSWTPPREVRAPHRLPDKWSLRAGSEEHSTRGITSHRENVRGKHVSPARTSTSVTTAESMARIPTGPRLDRQRLSKVSGTATSPIEDASPATISRVQPLVSYPPPPSVPPPPPPSVPPPPTSNPPPIPPLSDIPDSSVVPMPEAGPSRIDASSAQNQNQAPVENKAGAADDRRKIWADHVESLSAAAVTRVEIAQLDDQLASLTRLVQSSGFAVLPADARARIQDQILDLQTRRAEKGGALQRIIAQLAQTNSWPLAADTAGGSHTKPRPRSRSRSPSRVDLGAQIVEIKDAMVQLNELLVGASNHVAAQRAERESAAMEVDEDPGPSRLSAGPSVELEELRRRVAAIEERLADVGNDLVHREGELPDELYSLVEEKVHTMMSAHQAEQNRAAKQDRLIESLQKELKVSGEQSAMLVKDVGELARRTDAVHAENVHLRDENAELRAMVKQLQGVQTEKMEVMDSNLHALIAEVKARLEITSGAIPAPVPDMEDVLRHVTPPLMQKVHEELGPILVELHKTIRGMLDAQNTELRGTIFSKLAVTLKMVETVQAWADRLGVAGAGSVAHRQPGAH